MPKIGEQLAPSPENNEIEPKLVFDVLFSAHTRRADLKNFESHFKKADIFAPELITPDNEKIEEILNQLSFGKSNLPRVMGLLKNYGDLNGFFKEQLKIAHNSGKDIILADIPVEKIENNDNSSNYLDPNIQKALEKGDLDTAISMEKQSLKYLTAESKEREQLFTETLKKKIKSLLKNTPSLKNKPELRVLITFGALHPGLINQLRNGSTNEVTRTYNSMPMIFGHESEAFRNYYFNKEPDNEVVAKGLLEVTLESQLRPLYHMADIDSDVEMKLIRSATQNLSLDDIREIFDLLSKQYSFDVVMEAHGIKMHKLRDKIIEESRKILETTDD